MFSIGIRAIYQKDIHSAIKEAKENGFAVLEIHLSTPQFLPNRYSTQELQTLKDFAENRNIILQAHAPLEHSLIFADKNLRDGAKKQLDEMVKFCKLIGVKCLTLHPGKSAIYHTDEGKKLKDDELFYKFYSDLFEDSIKHIVSVAPENLFVCIENTDNFTSKYQQILNKYLPTGKIFLTWDIRKNYTYTTNELIEEQWKFVQKNKKYVRNIHVSGFGSAHGNLSGWEDKLNRFLKLFSDQDLPIIIETLPLQSAIDSKKKLIS